MQMHQRYTLISGYDPQYSIIAYEQSLLHFLFASLSFRQFVKLAIKIILKERALMETKLSKRHDRKRCVENEFRCDNIFFASEPQPYLDTTQAGKWGKGKDDSPAYDDDHPNINNPLPY